MRARWPLLSASIALALGCAPAREVSEVSGGPGCGAAQSAYEKAASSLSRLEPFGFSGAIVVRQRACSFEREFGFADRHVQQRVASGTAFDLGSITKFYTASAVLILRDRGLIDLDAPAQRYLPLIPADKASITVRNLLTQTSGLRDGYWDDPENRVLSEESYLTKMLALPLEFPPGATVSYNNFAFHLLKAIIERVSGRAYETFLRDEVLLPSNLRETGLRSVGWAESDLAKYQDATTRVWTSDGVNVENGLQRPTYLQPEGSGYLYGTARDLASFVQSVARGRIVKGGFDVYRPIAKDADNGMGVDFFPTPAGIEITKGGYDTTIGTVARFGYFPGTDLLYVVVSNTHLGGLMSAEIAGEMIESEILGEGVSRAPVSRSNAMPAPGTFLGPGGIELAVQIRDGVGFVSAADNQAVATLLLPGLASPTAPAPDPRIVRAITAIDQGDKEALFPLLPQGARTDRYFGRVRGLWVATAMTNGPLREIRVLASRRYVSGNRNERWIAFATIHENGRTLWRAIEQRDGSLAFTTLGTPAKIELQLAPLSDHKFAVWNPYLSTPTFLTFRGNGKSLEVSQSAATLVTLEREGE